MWRAGAAPDQKHLFTFLMNQLYVTRVPGLQGIRPTVVGVGGGVIKVKSEYAGGSFRAFSLHRSWFQNTKLIFTLLPLR